MSEQHLVLDMIILTVRPTAPQPGANSSDRSLKLLHIYFPVADMEAGLPDVTGDDSGGVLTGLAPLSTRRTSKSASLLYPGYHLQLPGPPLLPGFCHGLRQQQGVRCNQQSSLKC